MQQNFGLGLKSFISPILSEIKNTPEIKETFRRLIGKGENREEAMRKIALVVIEEIHEVVKNKENFNQGRFVNRLRRL